MQLVLHYQNTDVDYNSEEQAFIEQSWQQAIQNKKPNTLLFDGKLFGLTHWILKQNQLHLAVINTRYKSFVATRKKAFAELFPATQLALPVAICCSVITQDNVILLDKRQGVDVYAGQFHVIGGFMDRDLDMDFNNAPNAVNAVIREVKEETHLDLMVEDGMLTGLLYDQLTPHVELSFSFTSDKSFQQIQADLKKNPNDEVSRLYKVDNKASTLADFIVKEQENLTVTGFGCLMLHGKYSFGVEWYDSLMRQLHLTR